MSKAQEIADILGNDFARFIVERPVVSAADVSTTNDVNLDSLALERGSHKEVYHESPDGPLCARLTFDDGSVIIIKGDRWMVSHVMTQEEYEAGKELEMLRVMEGLQSP